MSYKININRDPYLIPKEHEYYIISREDHVLRLIKDLCLENRIKTNSKLISGCNIIEINNNFVFLLDESYKSFLMGMYYSSISLCSMAVKRLCYDFVEFADIRFDTKILDEFQKSYLFSIPLYRLIEFLFKMRYINDKIRKELIQINEIRNRYIHPTLEKIDSEKDAKDALNKLCNIIDSITN